MSIWSSIGFGLLLCATQFAAIDLPTIGIIDLYGLRSVAPEQIRTGLKIKEGDPAPVNFGDKTDLTEEAIRAALELPPGSKVPQNEAKILKELQKIPGVRQAKLAVICCEQDGKGVLFVGIEETNSPHPKYRDPPSNSVLLPPEVIEVYEQFMGHLMNSVRGGTAREDHSEGHAAFHDEALGKFTDLFKLHARRDLPLLKEVALASSNPKHRSAAAWMLGYASDKRSVLNELSQAARDPEGEVRNNAVRAIGAILELANRQPDLGINLDPEIFIEMLDSVTWSDRNKAIMVLLELSKKNDKNVLAKLKQKALPALTEMARWKAQHGLSALTLLGRTAGLSDDEIKNAWNRGEKERIIKQAVQQIIH